MVYGVQGGLLSVVMLQRFGFTMAYICWLLSHECRAQQLPQQKCARAWYCTYVVAAVRLGLSLKYYHSCCIMLSVC